jgi:hypothetical protein
MLRSVGTVYPHCQGDDGEEKSINRSYGTKIATLHFNNYPENVALQQIQYYKKEVAYSFNYFFFNCASKKYKPVNTAITARPVSAALSLVL